MEFTDPTVAASNALEEATDAFRDAVEAERSHDPDLAGLGEEPSDYDDLTDELATIDTATTPIEVPQRPGYALLCRIDYSGKDIDLLRKRSKDKTFDDGIDGVKFASLLLGLTCVGIERRGEPLELDGVSPITFTSPQLQARLGTSSADATIRKFFGLEGHVDAAGRRLMFVAGWGDTLSGVDPTQ